MSTNLVGALLVNSPHQVIAKRHPTTGIRGQQPQIRLRRNPILFPFLVETTTGLHQQTLGEHLKELMQDVTSPTAGEAQKRSRVPGLVDIRLQEMEEGVKEKRK
jgi:hypothetical protein